MSLKTTPGDTQNSVLSKRILSKGYRRIQEYGQKLHQLSIEYVPLETLKANDYNPNRQSERDFELLIRSIEEDGFTQPIIVNQDGVIIDGEHRWRAAHSLSMKEIPVVRVSMTEAQMRVSTLRHNTARGSHDLELEVDVLRDLEILGALDWAQDSLLLDDLDLQKLLEDSSVAESLAGEEFSSSWTPTHYVGLSGQKLGVADLEAPGPTWKGHGIIQSMPQTTFQKVQEHERKIQEAASEEERHEIRKRTEIYRLVLLYSGEDVTLMRRVLGDAPADKVLELIRGTI